MELFCKNTHNTLHFEAGVTLSEVFKTQEAAIGFTPIAAIVNNCVRSMNYKVFDNKTVEFIGLSCSAGRRIYIRTLFFVLAKAVRDALEGASVNIEFSISNGYYCKVNQDRELTDADVEAINKQMQNIVKSAYDIVHHRRPTDEVLEKFNKEEDRSKVSLIETRQTLYTEYYTIDDYADCFYGPLLTNTKELTIFKVEKYYDGILLRVPSSKDSSTLGEVIKQDKIYEAFQEYHRWQDTMGINTLGDLNKTIMQGFSSELILVFEALQEKKLSRIADEITNRKNVKIVLIAGPSSSGKTTTCKRLSIQLLTNGIRPVGISLDDYFVNRADTPLDANGNYDYESLYALNLTLFSRHLTALINGEEVELPRYDFTTGQSTNSGKKLRLQENDILIIEGIHALNPELTQGVPQDQIFRVYASALTTIAMDAHNYIPTTDNRLLRRIIRDTKFRNCNAQSTINRWPSVRAGEDKWIFPYQENADAVFNTAMIFELAAIKNQAVAALEAVPETCSEYAEARRLLHFLRYIKPISEDKIPPTSLLREFLGGSTFVY